MGREKARKPHRARCEWITTEVDGEPVTIRLPPGVMELTGAALRAEVVKYTRAFRARGNHDIAIVVTPKSSR